MNDSDIDGAACRAKVFLAEFPQNEQSCGCPDTENEATPPSTREAGAPELPHIRLTFEYPQVRRLASLGIAADGGKPRSPTSAL